MINPSEFLNKQTFSDHIEKRVSEENITYFEAIIEFSEDADKSPEELVPFMSQVLLEKVRKSANDSGLIDTGETDLESL